VTNQELEKTDSDKMKITFTSYTKTPLFVVELLEILARISWNFLYYPLSSFTTSPGNLRM